MAAETFSSEVSDRADKAIAHHFPGAGRKQIATLFDDGGVKVNGKRVKKGDRVTAGDTFELARAPAQSESPPQPNAEAGAALVVLREHAAFVAIAKPAGMPSQPLKSEELDTAANAIVARWPECASAVPEDADVRDGGLVHRLDIGTSGVLLAARTPEMYRALREAFGSGVVTKTYLALVENRPVSRECDLPLAQRGKKVGADMTDGLAAHTAFEVLGATDTHAVVRCVATTGRMHQVRAHLALVGSPIVGDALYGAAARGDGKFFLHAAEIVLPIDGERVTIEAPVPPAFAAARAELGL